MNIIQLFVLTTVAFDAVILFLVITLWILLNDIRAFEKRLSIYRVVKKNLKDSLTYAHMSFDEMSHIKTTEITHLKTQVEYLKIGKEKLESDLKTLDTHLINKSDELKQVTYERDLLKYHYSLVKKYKPEC